MKKPHCGVQLITAAVIVLYNLCSKNVLCDKKIASSPRNCTFVPKFGIGRPSRGGRRVGLVVRKCQKNIRPIIIFSKYYYLCSAENRQFNTIKQKLL